MAEGRFDLAPVLTDADLRRQFGEIVLERARDYVSRGRVLSCHVRSDSAGDTIIRGAVAGSGPSAYDVTVDLGLTAHGLWLDGRCTCPMVGDCKHVVALLLTARGQSAGEGRRLWERSLDLVLDELEGPDPAAPPERLALLVDLAKPVSRGYREWDRNPSSRGTLRLRPLRRGARGQWVRTGVAWHGVAHLHRQGFRHDHAALLEELVTGYRAAAQQGYYGSADFLSLSSFGAAVWEQLARAMRVGIELVPGPGLSAVHLADEPITLEVDVHTESSGELSMGVGARVGDAWHPAYDVEVLGRHGHGAAVFTSDDPGPSVTMGPLRRPAGPQVRRLLAADESLTVPAEARLELVTDYLPRLQRHLPVRSADGSVVVPERPLPRLALTVEWQAVDRVRLAWCFFYRVGHDDRRYALDETVGLRHLRDPEAEQALLDGLALDDAQAYRLCYGGDARRGVVPEQTLTDVGAIALAEDVLPGLVASPHVEVEEIGVRPAYTRATGAPVIRFGARDPGQADRPTDRPDWLDLEVVISVDGQFVGLASVLEALTLGRERVVLPTGLHIGLDRPEFGQLAELVAAASELQEQPRDGVRVHRGDLGLWDELADVGIVDAQASQWVRAAQALRGLVTLPDVEPARVRAQLRPYQAEGFRWLAFLWASGLGGILADDMGLGKTLQTLALVAHARANGAAPFLVVAPTSVVSTWAHEAATFTPDLRVRTVTESHARRGLSLAEAAADADLVVTSYTLFRLEVGDYQQQQWGGLVLDEAQLVKNHQGKTYQSVRRLDVPFRLALTGTPMENRLMELWSLLSIVAPGLYPHPRRFAELVANPVEKEGDTVVLERFRRRIRPFLLRRTKELVAADLPPKQEQVIEVTLNSRHRRIYETHLQRERQTVLGLVGDFDRHRIAIFRSLTRLRQLSLDAGLVDAAYDDIGSAKLDVLVDHLVEVVAEGHRALVFSQFTSFLTRARKRLDAEGITSSYLDGRTRSRAAVIDSFKDGEGAVFLISLKAGGVGLTLTEADYVFVLDPWWNPAVEAQAVDRAHRIGQKRPVMVYRLVSERTIEEKVMELKARKAKLFAQVVDGEGGAGTPIGADDVRALFED